jgi:hypothetical protein
VRVRGRHDDDHIDGRVGDGLERIAHRSLGPGHQAAALRRCEVRVGHDHDASVRDPCQVPDVRLTHAAGA